MINQRMMVRTAKPQTNILSAPPRKYAKPPPQNILARHIIEPELLNGYPRLLKRTHRPPEPQEKMATASWLFLLLPAVGIFLIIFSQYLPLIFLGAIITNLTAVIYNLLKENRRVNAIRDLLKYGKPKPAIAKHIFPRAEGMQLAYLYEDENNTLKEESLLISEHTATSYQLSPGKSFTVLQSLESGSIMPYFAIREFSVVPVAATAVSYQTSAKVAAQRIQATASQQPLRLADIEPELLLATPRHVRATSTARRMVAWSWTLMALLLTFALFLPDKNGMREVILMLMPLLFAMNYFLVRFVRSRPEDKVILRDWTPTVATITAGKVVRESVQNPERQIASFTYHYENHIGILKTGTIEMELKRAWQLGLYEGTCFTILCAPGGTETPVPYFQIRDAEIVGGTGAKITPP